MAKEDIVEGLRYALARGETLESAMMSFFNSGYDSAEIEEAARILQSPQVLPAVQQPAAPAQAPAQPAPQEPQAQPQPNQTQTQGFQQLPSDTSAPAPKQKISAYGAKPPSSGKAITIVLVLLLVVLLGILVSVFFFRSEISDFLSGFL